jgi:hypothetical protein
LIARRNDVVGLKTDLHEHGALLEFLGNRHDRDHPTSDRHTGINAETASVPNRSTRSKTLHFSSKMERLSKYCFTV